MEFNERLNDYIEIINCTAKDLCEISGLSASTISRYRSGERVPEINSEALERLCEAIVILAENKQPNITKKSVIDSFLECDDVSTADREQLRKNFNTLISIMNINVSKLCKYINYDSSTIFRIKSGSRQPAEPVKFAEDVACCVAKEVENDSQITILSELLECSKEELSDSS